MKLKLKIVLGLLILDCILGLFVYRDISSWEKQNSISVEYEVNIDSHITHDAIFYSFDNKQLNVLSGAEVKIEKVNSEKITCSILENGKVYYSRDFNYNDIDNAEIAKNIYKERLDQTVQNYNHEKFRRMSYWTIVALALNIIFILASIKYKL